MGRDERSGDHDHFTRSVPLSAYPETYHQRAYDGSNKMNRSTMRAAKFVGDDKIEIIEKPVPSIKANEVLLKVAYDGLCGSERRVFHGGFPFVPGHEMSGEIVEVGAKVEALRPGQRAIVYLLDYCGKCAACHEGDTHLCENRKGLIGWTWDGGYEEYISAPSSMIYPVDASFPLDLGVLALDTFGTSFHALRKSNFDPHKPTLVIGCGPLGLGVITILKKHYHAEIVYAGDLSGYRLKMAENIGAIPICVDKDKVEDSIRAQIKGDIDTVIEIVGSSSTLLASMCLVKRNGKVVLLGEPVKEFVIERKTSWLLKDFIIQRSFYFPWSEIKDNIFFIQQNEPIVRSLITNVYPLEKIAEAFSVFFGSDSGKVLIKL
ncbi:MAG: alcohol dehydrogenase catalytic domain-containing protein [Spirochaetes bacterium]|nr:alcohol dehydrogenase catalytic domain-containing protein [Spirochaetota bacterium]